MRICVIYGGISTEREVSIKTGKQIIESLKSTNHEVSGFLINDAKDVLKLNKDDIDFVYIALHGKFGEDGKVQAALEILEIPYSGPSVLASAICMDKDITKRIVKSYGVPVSKWWTIRKGEKVFFPENLDNLIVKPNSGGSSIGVSFVKNLSELEAALEKIFEIDDEAIIEEVLKGYEISVPIISGEVFPAVKIEALKSTYFDYNSKYDENGAREYVCEFEKHIQDQIEKYTKLAYYATKCQGFARVDYIVQDDIVYLVEINTLPGMTAQSLLPKSLKEKGFDYTQTIEKLIGAKNV